MPTNEPSVWNMAVNAAAVALAWVAGESGRVAVAGGAGGLSRWFNSEKKHLRGGIIAVIGGLVSGTYLWPLILAILGFPFGGLEETPNNIAMSAFMAGALGMSFVKILTAMIEARVTASGKDKQDG